MAGLIVEDGTGKEIANSYVTVAEADAYWELRNDSIWANLSDEDKIARLVDAAQYLDYFYRYIGDRYSAKQMMTWPRAVIGWDADMRDMYADIIPQRIKDAQCELARESAVGGPLLASYDRSARVASESVGALSVSYFSDAPSNREFPLVLAILSDLLVDGGSSITSQAVLG